MVRKLIAELKMHLAKFSEETLPEIEVECEHQEIATQTKEECICVEHGDNQNMDDLVSQCKLSFIF